jgi:hypothetical protein
LPFFGQFVDIGFQIGTGTAVGAYENGILRRVE